MIVKEDEEFKRVNFEKFTKLATVFQVPSLSMIIMLTIFIDYII